MRKSLGVAAMVCLLGLPAVSGAAQFCQSETEIPASTPTTRFSDHGDGTVTDNETGLMWAQCTEGLSGAGCAAGYADGYVWQAALDLAAGSRLADHTDWRLPNVKELFSILERQCARPAINTAVFPNTPASGFWSASPSVNYSAGAWLVDFTRGEASDNYNRGDTSRVRLVRLGQ